MAGRNETRTMARRSVASALGTPVRGPHLKRHTHQVTQTFESALKVSELHGRLLPYSMADAAGV